VANWPRVFERVPVVITLVESIFWYFVEFALVFAFFFVDEKLLTRSGGTPPYAIGTYIPKVRKKSGSTYTR
jgi:hypothetical protein